MENKVVSMTSVKGKKISTSKLEEDVDAPSDTAHLYNGIYADGEFLWAYNEKREQNERVARRVDIEGILEDIDTDSVMLHLAFKYKGRLKRVMIQRDEMRRQELLKYQRYGLNINDSNVSFIIKHLDNQEQKAAVKKVHEYLGWGIYDGKQVYKHYTAVGVDSRYKGNLDLEPRGSLEGWKKTVKENILGYTPSEAGLLFGLSAVVVGFLGMYHPVDSLVIHKYSDSSKGKTTIDMAAVSAFGSPEQKDNKLMVTWNATANSIMSDLSNNHGLAMALDEASMAEQKDFTSLLYRLAGGSDKRRMNKDLTKREAASWCTTILTNGENSLLARSSQNTGLRVRLFEYPNVTWTKSAEVADGIKAGVLKNYGHAGPEMARKMLEMGYEKIARIWTSWSEKCYEAMKNKDQFSNRVSKKLGILMATAEIATKALELEFNLDGFLKFLLSHDSAASEDRDLPQKAYDYFLDQYNINNKHFIKRHTLASVPAGSTEAWGSVSKGQDGTTEVAIITAVFEKLMREGNFPDTKVVLKAWKQRNLLDCEKDRLTRARKISDDNPINVYVVLIKGEKSKSKKEPDTEEDSLDILE